MQKNMTPNLPFRSLPRVPYQGFWRHLRARATVGWTKNRHPSRQTANKSKGQNLSRYKIHWNKMSMYLYQWIAQSIKLDADLDKAAFDNTFLPAHRIHQAEVKWKIEKIWILKSEQRIDLHISITHSRTHCCHCILPESESSSSVCHRKGGRTRASFSFDNLSSCIL